MRDQPLAYHITFGTYGARLHGDERRTVDRRHNTPGAPVLGASDTRLRFELSRLKQSPVILSAQQRFHIQDFLPVVCTRGGWEYLAGAAQVDHVHVLLRAAQEGKAVRRWLKVWLGQEMSGRWPLSAGQSWWAEGGSVKHVWDEAYLARVFDYIQQQRTTE